MARPDWPRPTWF